MYARNVTLHLKANTAPEFTRMLETDVLPILRRQNGFKDEITFLAADGAEAVAISLWDRKENADNYSRAGSARASGLFRRGGGEAAPFLPTYSALMLPENGAGL